MTNNGKKSRGVNKLRVGMKQLCREKVKEVKGMLEINGFNIKTKKLK